jgi:hypothetical protein
MVGRLQGTCGEIGGETSTVNFRFLFGLRWDPFSLVAGFITVYCVSVSQSKP